MIMYCFSPCFSSIRELLAWSNATDLHRYCADREICELFSEEGIQGLYQDDPEILDLGDGIWKLDDQYTMILSHDFSWEEFDALME